jgi:hypothetical protein
MPLDHDGGTVTSMRLHDHQPQLLTAVHSGEELTALPEDVGRGRVKNGDMQGVTATGDTGQRWPVWA